MGAGASSGLDAAIGAASQQEITDALSALPAQDKQKVLAALGASPSMVVGGGIQIQRNQYLAGFKEDRTASYPTVSRLDVQVAHKIDGTIDDVFKQYPDLESCLFNDVKVCNACGKPCAFTLTICNACGKPLPEETSKSENVFSAFLFGVKLAARGFPYTISLRRETEDVLIFDDMLQLSPCHLNGIPRRYYIPDWRFLLIKPAEGLKLLDILTEELWTATQPFMQDDAFRKGVYREGVTAQDIKDNIMISFNFPPSQFQMHVQWIVPPLTPFQHFMCETKNHFHEGRSFPMSYVRNVLSLDKPYDVKKNTPIEDITAYYKGLGVDYQAEWSEWYQKVCLGSTMAMQNWNPDDFKYVVQDGKAYSFAVDGGRIQLGDEVTDVEPSKVQTVDKAALQNYGRPYNDAGKPSGTYIQNPLEPKWGEGGFLQWPPS